MRENKIAIMADSGCDIPNFLLNKHKIYRIPYYLVCKDKTYKDTAISLTDLYRLMENEKPVTTLPDHAEVLKILRVIREHGYQKVLSITIASHQSGMYDLLRQHTQSQKGLEMEVIDSCNISLGAGMLAINAAEYLEQDLPWDALKERLLKDVKTSKAFFCLKTLKYLRQNTKIGPISAFLGDSLNIKPILTCDSKGINTTKIKALGYKQALPRLSESVQHFTTANSLQIAVMHGAAEQEATRVKERVLAQLPQAKLVLEGPISPVLAVHSGPGLVGIAVMSG